MGTQTTLSNKNQRKNAKDSIIQYELLNYCICHYESEREEALKFTDDSLCKK
jgi:hypothetical protein